MRRDYRLSLYLNKRAVFGWALAMAVIVNGVNLFDNHVVTAQQSQLQQQITPYECMYTTVETGGEPHTDNTCDGQPIPLLASVDVNKGRPILYGTFSADQSASLRIWINGQWYTLGTDARVTVNDDDWKLDLSGLTAPLQPGVYTVMVEAQTNSGLLLRNTSAGSFIVLLTIPVIPPNIPLAQQTLLQNLFQSGVFIPTIIPQTQEGVELPDTVRPPKLPDVLPDVNGGNSNLALNGWAMRIAYVSAAVLFIGVGIWLARQLIRR